MECHLCTKGQFSHPNKTKPFLKRMSHQGQVHHCKLTEDRSYRYHIWLLDHVATKSAQQWIWSTIVLCFNKFPIVFTAHFYTSCSTCIKDSLRECSNVLISSNFLLFLLLICQSFLLYWHDSDNFPFWNSNSRKLYSQFPLILPGRIKLYLRFL